MEREAAATLCAAPHATPAGRAALGKAARRNAPRSSRAEFTASPRLLCGDAHLLNFPGPGG